MARFCHERTSPERGGPIGIGEIVRTAADDSSVFPELVGLRRLDAVIKAAMPDELRSHCQIGRFTAGTLTLFAGSPVWAARLRYFAPTLLDRLAGRPGAPAIQAIRVRVLMPGPVNPSAKRTGPAISREVSEYLRAAADCCGDARLTTVLLSLSRHFPG